MAKIRIAKAIISLIAASRKVQREKAPDLDHHHHGQDHDPGPEARKLIFKLLLYVILCKFQANHNPKPSTLIQVQRSP